MFFSFLVYAAVPTHDTPLIYGIPDNGTSSNLSCYPQNIVDSGGHIVYNDTVFWKNNVSFESFYLSFEANQTEFFNTPQYTSRGSPRTTLGGKRGSGANFTTGTDDALIYNNSVLDPNEGTIFLWTNPFSYGQSGIPGTGSWDYILFAMGDDVNNRIFLNYYSEEAYFAGYQFFISNSTTTDSISTMTHRTVGVWESIAITWKRNAPYKIYRDGVLNSTSTVNTPTITLPSNGKMFIGGYYEAGIGTCNCTLDEIRMYKRELTAEEIATLHESTTPKIVSSELVVNDTWICSVRPSDALYATGITKNSSMLIINGTSAPPYVPSIFDTCTYSGTGDWIIQSFDNCEINSTVNLGGNGLYIFGQGFTWFKFAPKNFNKFYMKGNSSIATCRVKIGS